MSRVHHEVEDGLAWETCSEEGLTAETVAALDDLARAAANMMSSAESMGIVTVTTIWGQYRAWCHNCREVRYFARRTDVIRFQQTHECPHPDTPKEPPCPA